MACAAALNQRRTLGGSVWSVNAQVPQLSKQCTVESRPGRDRRYVKQPVFRAQSTVAPILFNNASGAAFGGRRQSAQRFADTSRRRFLNQLDQFIPLSVGQRVRHRCGERYRDQNVWST